MNSRSYGRAALGLVALGAGALAWKRLTMRQDDLRGAVILITGGSRGLGLLLARQFAQEGAQVAICARDADELERARGTLASEGAEVFAQVCDVTDSNNVRQLIAAVTNHYGRIDVLVNNAGIIGVGPLASMKRSDFEAAMNVNFWGIYNTVEAVLPQMRARRSGRIVNITSFGGKVAVPHLLPYSCAKFAAVGFTQGLRAELARDGIVVTNVAPGTLRTGSHVHAEFKGNQEEEFRNFALSATLPGLAWSAEAAAKRAVLATKRGEAEVLIGLPANLGATVNALFPGVTADLLGLVNTYLLPGEQGGTTRNTEGREVQSRLPALLQGFVRALGERAIHQNLETPPGNGYRPGPVGDDA